MTGVHGIVVDGHVRPSWVAVGGVAGATLAPAVITGLDLVSLIGAPVDRVLVADLRPVGRPCAAVAVCVAGCIGILVNLGREDHRGRRRPRLGGLSVAIVV